MRLATGLALAVLCAGCTRTDPDRSAEQLDALRAEVRSLGAVASQRFLEDPLMAASGDVGEDMIAVGVRVATLREMLRVAASHYLDDVRLHVDMNAVVRKSDAVRVRVGPVNATAGRWDLAVTVQRLDALLRAGTIEISVGDSNRLDLVVPVEVRDARGTALIDFKWNAARLASVVCSDFAVHETFAGFVQPHTARMRGYLAIDAVSGRMVARPVLRDRIFVSPQPTPQSWERVREILREQDRIFRCGLALSPDRMESMLRDLFTQGFRFHMPASVLRPIPLPGSVLNEVEVAGRRVSISVVPEPSRLTAERLWLRAAVRASALDDEPIRIDGGSVSAPDSASEREFPRAPRTFPQ
jgi:hypothetical protein